MLMIRIVHLRGLSWAYVPYSLQPLWQPYTLSLLFGDFNGDHGGSSITSLEYYRGMQVSAHDACLYIYIMTQVKQTLKVITRYD
jgi:hypothetical protein